MEQLTFDISKQLPTVISLEQCSLDELLSIKEEIEFKKSNIAHIKKINVILKENNKVYFFKYLDNYEQQTQNDILILEQVNNNYKKIDKLNKELIESLELSDLRYIAKLFNISLNTITNEGKVKILYKRDIIKKLLKFI